MATYVRNNTEEGLSFKFTVFTFVVLIIMHLVLICMSQHHHHHNEPASFIYSKEANKQDMKHLHDRQKHHHEAGIKRISRPYDTVNVNGNIFIQAFGSTVLISAAPFLMLFLIPLDNTNKHKPFLKVMLSFASGGLLGDAFLHLIPHAVHYEHHQDHEGHLHNMSIGLCVLGGIITFLLVEKTVRLIKIDDQHDQHHCHNHIVADSKKNASKNDEKKNNGKKNDHQNKLEEMSERRATIKVIGVAAYLNLAADCLHNFTDGLAIGASYLAGTSVGYVTTFTILLHEIPHEIGDFAMLIQSGCSKTKAIMLQLVTAIGALLGTYISLLVGDASDLATKWILPFTAGGFIYIATVSVIPELLSDTKFWQSVKEIIAILVGVYMMVLVAEYE